MTDIPRPSNPALSLSSFTDDTVTYRSLKGYPDRIEIVSPSPRTTITPDSLENEDEFARSKSAPPQPIGTTMEMDNLLLLCDDVVLLSTNSNSHAWPRSDSAPPGIRPVAGQTNNEIFETNPDIDESMRALRAATAVAFANPVVVAAIGGRVPVSSSSFSSNSSSRQGDDDTFRNAEDEDKALHFKEQQQESTQVQQQQLLDGRQLTRPIPQAPGRLLSPLYHQLHSSQGNTLILRPNPVKAIEIATTSYFAEQLVREPIIEDGADEEKSSVGEGNKVYESWCEQANRTRQRQIRIEQQRQRKQEFQTNFPENLPTPMTPVEAGEEEDVIQPDNYTSRLQSQQQQHHRDRMNSLRGSSGAESYGNRNINQNMMHPAEGASLRSAQQPTPLFERLVTEEVQELKTYAGIVERQNFELAKQKKVQEDLEARLRAETRRRKELESLLEEQERVWSEKFAELEQQRNTAEKKLQDEQTKTKKLINQVQRKDRDIHDFFKKKYDHDGGRSVRSSVRGGLGGPTERNAQSNAASAAREYPQQSPQQLLNDLGSDEKVREGNAKNLLLDFFGI